MKKIILTVFITALIMPLPAQAHPGRTDANGGHYCRTKCEKWGLKAGEYHKHSAEAKTKKAKTQAKTKAK